MDARREARPRTGPTRRCGRARPRPPGREAVQRHQVDERARAEGTAAEPARDRRRIERVVEVGVADEDAGNLAGGIGEALERCRVRARRPAQQEILERKAREVGVDEERLALAGEPVARDPEPLQLEPGRKSRALASSSRAAWESSRSRAERFAVARPRSIRWRTGSSISPAASRRWRRPRGP